MVKFRNFAFRMPQFRSRFSAKHELEINITEKSLKVASFLLIVDKCVKDHEADIFRLI